VFTTKAPGDKPRPAESSLLDSGDLFEFTRKELPLKFVLIAFNSVEVSTN
jgi:hypothetical protein